MRSLLKPEQQVLSSFPQLRILHLKQQDFFGTTAFGDHIDMIRLVTYHSLQKFADAFFRYIHAKDRCPQLHTLVVGNHNEEVFFGDRKMYLRPQHCYLRGVQLDPSGRNQVVGVLASRARVQSIEPCADILDCDVFCDRQGPLPGRLHSV